VPDELVRIEAPDLGTAEPIVLELRDEEILLVEPDTVVGYTSAMVGGDAASRPFR